MIRTHRQKNGGSTARWSLLMLAVAMLVGCGTWLGNPSDQESTEGSGNQGGKIYLAAKGFASSDQTAVPGVPVIEADGTLLGHIELKKAEVATKGFELKSAASLALLDDQTSLRRGKGSAGVSGAFVVDLLSGAITPAPTDLVIDEGEYGRLELELVKSGGGDAGESALTMVGVFITVDGQEKPFRLSHQFTKNLSIDLTQDGKPLVVTKGAAINLAFSLDLTPWFDFSNEASNPNGVEIGPLIGDEFVLEPTDEQSAIFEVIDQQVYGSGHAGHKERSKPSETEGEVKPPEGEAKKDEVDQPVVETPKLPSICESDRLSDRARKALCTPRVSAPTPAGATSEEADEDGGDGDDDGQGRGKPGQAKKDKDGASS